MNTNFWIGIVESRNDPQMIGRVQVRVFGAHNPSLDEIPTEALPWAVCLQPSASASISGIGTSSVGYVPGTMVYGFFMDGESAQSPVILGSAHGIPISKSAFNIRTLSEETSSQQSSDSTLYVRSTVATETVVATTSGDNSALKAALGKRESSNNYQAVNQLNYLGKYQMGAAMLTDLGYVKKGTTNKGLNSDENWTGKDGIKSKTDFLNSSSVQESAIDAELAMNTKRLEKLGVIDDTTTDQEKAGFLATSHLLGTGGARDMKSGKVKSDANGVTGNEYYQLGYKAVAGVASNVAPEATTADNPYREPSPVSTAGKIETTSKKARYGFGDPDGVYPRYLLEQDTNRLARNQNIQKTIVAFKEASLDRNVRIANSGATWSQSPVPFNATYPFNHVVESESGHVFEVDDTPKNERISQFHTSGTFSEIDRNGTRVNKIVGDDYEIIERNGFVHIKGNVSITVEGNANILVANDCELEVNGDFNSNVTGDMNFAVGGDFKLRTGGDSHITAGGTFAVDGEEIYIQSSVSTAGSLSLPTSASTGVPVFDALTLESRNFESLSEFESDDATDEEISEHRKLLTENGVLDETIEAPKLGEDTPVATNNIAETPVECSMFVSGKLNNNDYISPSYRLKDVTLGRQIKAQGGLQDVEIACNLKSVAMNLLEPIKKLYPDMIITSGYREYGSNSRSQHPLGMAVDLQFTKTSDYLAIAKSLASVLVFDQLILEYDSDVRVGGIPKTWIHISFNRAGNRKQVFTMNRNARITEFGVLKAVT